MPSLKNCRLLLPICLIQKHSSEVFATQNNANEKIMRIEEQSIMLQDANTVIANIAEQTNLLAMNAAIEGSITETSQLVEQINQTGSALSEISGKVADNIKQIGSEIDLFKV